MVVLSNDRIAGWHENENIIAAHMDDAKRSTVQEHVYHKQTGQLTAMGTGHVPKVIQVNPDTRSGGRQPYQHDRIYDSSGIATALNLDSSRTQVFLSDPLHKFDKEKQPRVRESCIVETDSNCSTITGNVAKNSNAQPWVDLQLRDGRDNRSTLRSGRTTELGFTGHSIRRLTEIECERLQGFPDNHTQFGNYDGVIKKIPKTQRYKLMGNAVTVDIVALVASRIKLI